jgi:amidase
MVVYLSRLVFVERSHVFYAFDPCLKPAAIAEPGDLVFFETQDCLGGQIESEEDTIEKVDFSRVNPATGPLYVEGAEPGDALVMDVLSIEVSEKGFVVTAPGAGVLGDKVKKSKTRVCRVIGDYVEYAGLKIPAWRMIGVIGVASSEKSPTGIPGRHGGNLDTKFITTGARVYLPVFYEGGLLGIGDLHAVMGHGEVCVAACEVSGSVLARVNVLKNTAPAWPIVEYGDSLYILVSKETISDSILEAADIAVSTLSKALGLEWIDAYMLTSLAVDVGISQLVDPRKTVWVKIPKYLAPVEKVLTALATL